MKIPPGTPIEIKTRVFAARWSLHLPDEAEVRSWANDCLEAGVVTDRLAVLAYSWKDDGGPDALREVNEVLTEVGCEIPTGQTRSALLALGSAQQVAAGSLNALAAAHDIFRWLILSDYEPAFLCETLEVEEAYDRARSESERQLIETEAIDLMASFIPRLEALLRS